MKESTLRDVLVHQININIRLQELIYDLTRHLDNPDLTEGLVGLMSSIRDENQAMLTKLTQERGT